VESKNLNATIPRGQSGIMLRVERLAMALCLISGSLMSGCAYVPPDMMPGTAAQAASQQPSRFRQDKLLVAPVTGVENSLWRVVNGDVMVSISTFQEALVRSLGQSALFGQVSNQGSARFVLRAEIKKQDKLASGARLAVRYELIDTAAGNSVFAEEIETSSRMDEDSAPSALLSPNSSMSRAAFRAAGKNIEVLLNKLRSIG
jgi:hypothetical protein